MSPKGNAKMTSLALLSPLQQPSTNDLRQGAKKRWIHGLIMHIGRGLPVFGAMGWLGCKCVGSQRWDFQNTCWRREVRARFAPHFWKRASDALPSGMRGGQLSNHLPTSPHLPLVFALPDKSSNAHKAICTLKLFVCTPEDPSLSRL